MGWQFHDNVPSDTALKAADERVVSREAAIRRPAEEVFVISDEDYGLMQQRLAQREEWDIINLEEVRRRNMFTVAMILQYLEKFKSFTNDEELFERVSLALCRSIAKDFLLYCFLDSVNPEKDPSSDTSVYNLEKITTFGTRELSRWFTNRDIYNVLKAMNQKKSPSALIADKLKRDLEEVNATLELLDLLPTIPRWPNEGLKDKISRDIDTVGFDALTMVCYPDVEPKTFEVLDKRYLSDLHGKLESQVSRPYYLDRNQYEPAKKILNSPAHVQAYFVMHQCVESNVYEPNRPSDKEGLLLAKKILSAIMDDNGVKLNLIENILSFHLKYGRLVEVTAGIRNEIYKPDSLEKNDEFKAQYKAAKDVNLKEFPKDVSKLKKVEPPVFKLFFGGGGDPKDADTYFLVHFAGYY